MVRPAHNTPAPLTDAGKTRPSAVSRRSFTALCTLSVVTACAAASTAPPVAAPERVAPPAEPSVAAPGASAPPAASPAQASTVVAAPSASVASLPSGDVHVPPLFAALFEQGRTWTYSYTFGVDAHDVDPPGKRTGPPPALTVTCKVASVSARRGARIAEISCSKPESDFSPPGELDEVFVATADGLWLASSAPTTDEAVAELLKQAPWMPAAPVAFSTSKKSAPGVDFPFTEGSAVARELRKVGAKGVTAWCRRDFDTASYGHDSRRCIAAGVGVVYRFEAGRAGPSAETVTLVATRAALQR